MPATIPAGFAPGAGGGEPAQSGELALCDPDGARTRWQHGGAAVAVAFAPDGSMFASGGTDGVLLLGSAVGSAVGSADGEHPPQRLVDHTAAVTRVEFRGGQLAFAVAGAPGEGEREGVVDLP